jgi:hypothetical protein
MKDPIPSGTRAEIAGEYLADYFRESKVHRFKMRRYGRLGLLPAAGADPDRESRLSSRSRSMSAVSATSRACTSASRSSRFSGSTRTRAAATHHARCRSSHAARLGRESAPASA